MNASQIVRCALHLKAMLGTGFAASYLRNLNVPLDTALTILAHH